MSLSDAAYLEQLKLTRDSILAALLAGTRVVSYGTDNIRVTREQAQEILKGLRDEITHYERKVNAASSTKRGPNLANFKNWG